MNASCRILKVLSTRLSLCCYASFALFRFRSVATVSCYAQYVVICGIFYLRRSDWLKVPGTLFDAVVVEVYRVRIVSAVADFNCDHVSKLSRLLLILLFHSCGQHVWK